MPISISVFWTRHVTPSVTSWSSASTSFVSREMMRAGAVALEVAEREPLQVAEELLAQVGEDPLADPAREVRLRRARRPGREPAARNATTIQVSAVDVAGHDALVDRELREVRRSERGDRGGEERGRSRARACAVRPREPRAARPSRRRCAARSSRRPARRAPRMRCDRRAAGPSRGRLSRSAQTRASTRPCS